MLPHAGSVRIPDNAGTVQKGLSLIELLIAVVIIGILAAVAIPKFPATKQRTSPSARIAD